MYQIKLSTDIKFLYWIQYLGDVLDDEVAALGGVFARERIKNRYCICYAAESKHKRRIKSIIMQALVDLYTHIEKRAFFLNKLDVRFFDALSRDMLVNTLSHFNLLSEREYVFSRLNLSNDFNLDGFYYFMLRELKEEWNESVTMIKQNADLVFDEETFNVIIKFLLSGIEAESKIISVNKSDREYILSFCDDKTDFRCHNAEQLLLKIVNIAPEKVIVKSGVTDGNLRKKLRALFCVREESL